jgi:DNA-binding NarL/FixJ family response regulator
VIRILIVDDHKLLRTSLKVILAAEAGLEVVGECTDGAEALDACTTTRPEVVLMDISMPKMSGIDVTGQLRLKHPQIRVLMLTASISADNIQRAASAGASGFLLKCGDCSQLGNAIRTVARGGTVWPAGISVG